MTKTNPLFVDSTKLHGDAIGTHVELRNILVYDDEEVFLVITTHQGVSLRIEMKAGEGRCFEGRVHLNHQKSITYYFVIEKRGKTVLQSNVRKTRAQYAIIEDWQPLGTTTATIDTQTANATETPWSGEYARSMKSLIDKFGL